MKGTGNMNSTRVLVGIALCVIAGTIVASPLRCVAKERQNPKARPAVTILDRIRANDKDGDGKNSKDAAGSQLQRFFDRVDTNRDGDVDETELKALRVNLTE
jgi:hypothetical protein